MFFFFQAEDGIRDLVRSRGLGDVYKRQLLGLAYLTGRAITRSPENALKWLHLAAEKAYPKACLLYTSDAADERSSVDLGGRRIIKKKKTSKNHRRHSDNN